jgi:hypothetical protein
VLMMMETMLMLKTTRMKKLSELVGEKGLVR